MFSVEYHSANVLFDTGATHSFVTASWVESHNIPVAPMYPPMRVSSVGGRTQIDKFCPSTKVQIWEIEFPANLIVMGNRDTTIDVILGMNWLTKYQASLSCDKRTVKLVSLSREEVLVGLVLSGPRKGSCHQVTAHIEEIKPSEAINVVSEFPYVFPEVLPGMPPERKVEFAIELIPGTALFLREPIECSDQNWWNSRSRLMGCQRKATLDLVPRLGQPQCYLWIRRMEQRGCALTTDP
jgi:hypothetical protein